MLLYLDSLLGHWAVGRLVYCHMHQGVMKFLTHEAHRVNSMHGNNKARNTMSNAKLQNGLKIVVQCDVVWEKE